MQSQSTTKGNLSWADIEGCATYSSYDPRSTASYGAKKPEAPSTPNSVRAQRTCKEKTTPRAADVRRSSRQCYTCKPRGKVLKHIINGSDTGNVIFHFDLHKRPLILVTTKKHYESFYEIPHNEVMELFKSVKTFCDFWAIKDYGISYNPGAWQTHPHFHIKIKTNEKIINRLRRDHFALLTLNTNYSQPSPYDASTPMGVDREAAS